MPTITRNSRFQRIEQRHDRHYGIFSITLIIIRLEGHTAPAASISLCEAITPLMIIFKIFLRSLYSETLLFCAEKMTLADTAFQSAY